MLLKNYLAKLKTHFETNFSVAKAKDVKKKQFYLSLAIPVAASFWLIDSFTHYFWYDELKFELIPSDGNDLWMRCCIFMLLTSFGLFADFTSRRRIANNELKNQAENISRAKKQWELVVDSLPQLVIAMDQDARITRVNRTIETWGIGEVNKVDGLYVSDFLKCFNKNYAEDAWTSDWAYIWQQIKNRDTIVRKIEKDHTGKTYHYTLRKISEFDVNKDQCFAVLVIDDITTRQDVEKSLKDQSMKLEEEISTRTLELELSNKQLGHELRAQKIAKEKLRKSQESRLGLLRDLFNAQETERKRIACELHDSIGQSLGATKFKIEELLIDKKNFVDEHDQYNSLVTTITNAIQEVRHIAMALRPAMLDDLGALPTLKWFCREFNTTYTEITVKLLLNIDESDLSKEKKVIIFRIVQEAMNNIAKHANATNIVLELSKSDSGINMRISDNGCGFDMKLKSCDDPNQPNCNFGLRSMRERAESTNGKFVIESTPGSGTSITVSWRNKDVLSFGEKNDNLNQQYTSSENHTLIFKSTK